MDISSDKLAKSQTRKHGRKGNLKRETESLQMAAQNAIRTNYNQQYVNRKSSDRDEAINHIISECSKLAQKKFKTKHDLVGKVIHRELCKKLKFDYTAKWYMHKPESILKN